MEGSIERSEFRLGVYSLAEAARYVRSHPQTVRSWFRPSPQSGRKPVFISDYPAEADPALISFHDLIDLRVAARLRECGVSMQHIRKVYETLSDSLDRAHPFCYKKLFVHNGRIFAGVARELGDAALVEVLSGQGFIESVMRPHLKRIDYDPTSLMARRWRISDGILLDPRVRLGNPVVAGTRIPSVMLARAYEAEGRDAAYVAELYGVKPADVENAAAFENRARRRKAA